MTSHRGQEPCSLCIRSTKRNKIPSQDLGAEGWFQNEEKEGPMQAQSPYFKAWSVHLLKTMAAVVQLWDIRGAIPQHCPGIQCVFSLLGSTVGSNPSFLVLSAPLLSTVFFGTYSLPACSSRQTLCIRRFYSTENFCLYIVRRSDFYELF